MGPFFEIAAYAPCETVSAAKQHINDYLNILSQIGVRDTELSDLLQANAQLLPRHEFVQVPNWYDIQVLDMVVSARPYMMSWAPHMFAQLDKVWVQVGLYFDAPSLLNNAGYPFGVVGDSFPRGVSRVLWKLVRSFSSEFGSEGVYLVSEDVDYPWEVLHGSEGNLWSFHLAIIPTSLQRAFIKPPDYITLKHFEDGIGFVSRGTEQWPIVWQELPWNND